MECLIPIDMNPSRDGARLPDTPLCLSSQPLQRPLILRDKRLEHLKAALVVLFDPRELVLREHRVADHLRLDGHTCETLEAEPDGSVKVVLGRDALHEERRLDTHAELAVRIC